MSIGGAYLGSPAPFAGPPFASRKSPPAGSRHIRFGFSTLTLPVSISSAFEALLWNDRSAGNGKAQDAEKLLGDACVRLEQMQAQGSAKGSGMAPSTGLRFSMDDALPAAMDVSCYKFKNPAFLDQLGWPEELQRKVIKLETLR